MLEALKAFINAGGYDAGDQLPPERELIVALDVTRNHLRRALDTLEREGAIWRHVGKGTFVAGDGDSPDAPGLAELSRRVTPMQLMRGRLSLEPAIAREAAANASAEALFQIQTARDRAVAATNWDSYEAADDEFHQKIAEATGNVLLLSLFDHLNRVRRAVSWNSVIRESDRPPRDHASFAEHDKIVAAIEARDPPAAHDTKRDHLNSVGGRLFRDL